MNPTPEQVKAAGTLRRFMVSGDELFMLRDGLVIWLLTPTGHVQKEPWERIRKVTTEVEK